MKRTKDRTIRRSTGGLVILTATVAALALAGCSSGSANADASSASSSDSNCKTLTLAQAQKATSAADFGGQDCLVQAAEAEGHLNVITLPPSWANYGKIISGFQAKYPQIKINSENPNGSSADEIAAVKADKGQSNAPDVLDLGTAVLSQNLNSGLFARYKVANWNDIPADFKDPNGLWYYDYTGVMSIGYDSSKFKTAPTSLNDLLGSEYKNSVTIVGDPTQANQAAIAVYLAALENGGSADNVTPGITFFQKLKQAGNFITTLPSQATVASGETPVVIQWSYNNVAWGPAAGSAGNPNWKVVVPSGAALGSYYNQTINADSPNPAAARLWEEWLYQPAQQNLWLAAGAYPSMLTAMEQDGTVDNTALNAVGKLPSDFIQFTAAQTAAAGNVLNDKWHAAVG